MHILKGYLAALDALDEVIALIRKSSTAEDARDSLIDFLKIDGLQARAIFGCSCVSGSWNARRPLTKPTSWKLRSLSSMPSWLALSSA
jgi:hypothetical protein